MAVRAYVLIETEVGKAAAVAAAVRDLDGVVSADDVTGRYDVITLVEAVDVDTLGRMVVEDVQQIPGIRRTSSCIVINL